MSMITVNYPYSGFILEIIVDASDGADFIIKDIKLYGKDAKELIGWDCLEGFSEDDFTLEVEAYYLEKDAC